MKTAFIYRLGAFGDVLHASHLPRLIKEYYKIDHLSFETSVRGYQILQNNPYIDCLTYLDPDIADRNTLITKFKQIEDEYDMAFNLIYTIEREYCCNEDDRRYYRNNTFRRDRCGKMNFYDVMTKACHLPDCYLGTRGELYYPQAEHDQAKKWIEDTKSKNNADWIILLVLSGSSMHKRFQSAESIARKILAKYPGAYIVLSGDKDCQADVFEGDRIKSIVGKWNFRTAALMAKYFDFVIGPETGLMCVSHLWDTPALQLLTAASPENHLMYAQNAYYVKSDAPCSPCHKNPVSYFGCTRKNDLPLCAALFDEDKIMEKVEEAYVRRTEVAESRAV